MAVPSLNQEPDQPSEQSEGEIQNQAAQTTNDSPTAAIPIPRDADDLEQGDDLAATLVNEEESGPSSSRSRWASLTSVSLGAFSGGARRKTRDDRDR